MIKNIIEFYKLEVGFSNLKAVIIIFFNNYLNNNLIKIIKKVITGEFIGPYRVWQKDIDIPGLAMTRSFGDKMGK